MFSDYGEQHLRNMIEVVGLGYIGLPTALMLAANDNKVIGVDRNEEIVVGLKERKLRTTESGIPELFQKALENDIQFSQEHVKADMYIIAVPTPYVKKDKRLDARYVLEAIREVCEVAPEGAVVVVESTVSPGTIDHCIRLLADEMKIVIGKDIHIAHAPERIIPGRMVYELVHNARTIGVNEQEVGEKIKQVYQSFCKGEIILTDLRTAEMIKVVENAYRDINIAFANELTKICRSDELDVYKIIEIANKHPRVNILDPGPGVGGHCISVDPWFLVGDYPGLANIILAARKINDSMPEFVLERIAEIMVREGIADVSKVGLYGLTYKENVDDIRESPTLQLLECMRKHLAYGIKVYDPYVKNKVHATQYEDFSAFINDVDFVVIMVAHDQILRDIKYLKGKVVLDTRNKCDLEEAYRL